jgi:hypothetical protein
MLTQSHFTLTLPGPTRKRAPRAYCFQLTYHNPEPDAAGCVFLWEVQGGREEYQVALERQVDGALRWHCTCADHSYRSETEGKVCKHVRGLLALGRPLPEPVLETEASLACAG